VFKVSDDRSRLLEQRPKFCCFSRGKARYILDVTLGLD